ncbi:hypothetical protein BHE74_00038803, partial [Ensete ventricosum]
CCTPSFLPPSRPLCPRPSPPMGCGGSKQDVATGNTITRRILRRPSSISKSKASSVSANGDASKKQAAEANGAAGEAKLVSKESSEEYFSSRREIECLDVATGSEGAEYFYPIEDSDANVKTVVGSGEIAVSEANNCASFGPKEEKEQIGRKEDDGMHHIVERSTWINRRIYSDA